jgi:hypothetical protein
MRTWFPAVPDDLRVRVSAAGFFKGIGKDAETSSIKRPGRQDSVVVGGCRKSKDDGRLPGGIQGGGAEGVAREFGFEGTTENAVKKSALSGCLFFYQCFPG